MGRMVAAANERQPLLCFSLQAHPTYINAIAFDIRGTRLYAGDAAGHVKEFSVEVEAAPGSPMIKPLRSNTQLKGASISQVSRRFRLRMQ